MRIYQLGDWDENPEGYFLAVEEMLPIAAPEGCPLTIMQPPFVSGRAMPR